MNDLDKTMRYVQSRPTGEIQEDLLVTLFDGTQTPRTISLNAFAKPSVSFGRGASNDIVLSSVLVSGEHGRFVYQGGAWVIQDKAVYAERGSTNGLICNDAAIQSRVLADGDLIRIDDGVEALAEGVLMVFSAPEATSQWQAFPLDGKSAVTIGRAPSCDITLRHISASKLHARLTLEGGRWVLADCGSTNGTILNNAPLIGRVGLQEKDVISITNSTLIFTSSTVYWSGVKSGISVDASNVVITRGSRKKVTCDHVSLSIRPGELVAIIGGSGAGKSTLLNSLCGYLPPADGKVYINGVDLYRNFDALKKLIGYVPQQDIVYDNLTLHDMLAYTAKLRLPKDVSAKEREAAIARAIELVRLKGFEKHYIKAMSGGQRKRASIAVELLSDPNLLFLDEPASGLDPGTERSLMLSLREMADYGKTVILVTHSTLQLKLCDRIVFMGRGGKLCCFASYDEALRFFGIDDIVDVYQLITDNPESWQRQYASAAQAVKPRSGAPISGSAKYRQRAQLPVLCARYMKLVFNDRQRLLLLLLQAPILALLVSIVANGNQFEELGITKSLLFALSCSAFWVGMLNAIQEICKERTILRREYMNGLSLPVYIASKIIVLGGLCLIQSASIVLVFGWRVGLPESGLLMHPLPELMITTFLTALASASMGLFVSSLFTNADRAMTVAPILLMPQILFSGLIFTLEGATEIISWLAVCRWSMEGYGTTANLNALPTQMQLQGFNIPHTASDFFTYEASHLLRAWGLLAAFVVVFLALACLVLTRIGKEKS